MQDSKKLRIVIFPWLAFGHMIPFLELSKRLASKGHHIFYISTPRNLERLPKIPQNISPFINPVSLPLPRVENLPPDAEATTDVGFEMGADLLKKAYDGLQEPIKEFLEASTNSSCPFDCIIYDFACYWLPSIADDLGIRKIYFSIFTARVLTVMGPMSNMLKDDGAGVLTNPNLLTNPPWSQSIISSKSSTSYFLPHEARVIFRTLTEITSSGVSDLFRFRSCLNNSDMIIVRSCMELEDEYLHLVEKLNQKTILTVGLLPPLIEESQEDETWKSIIGWLERQRCGSVVYVAFGSEAIPSQEQLTELAHGVELSGLPFFWVFRTSGVSSVELPDGFEERTRNRGLVWTSWVPQLRILSHDSVGGFLTHAGWSSIIETLKFGKPLIMLPLLADQGLNARLMGEKKVGIEIPRNEEDGSFTRYSVAVSISLVLLDEAGQMYRDEAKNIGTIFANESLNNQYIDKFNDYLNDLKTTF